jgi:hypothetical protein
MNTISFKSLKFFKSQRLQTKKQKESAPSPKKEGGFLKRAIQNPFVFVFIFVVIAAYVVSYLPSKSLPLLSEGEIASADIIAPTDLTIEDKETTEKRRQEAMDAVLPVYSLDKNVFLNTEIKIREFFNSGRELLNQPSTPAIREEFQNDIREKYGIEISSKDLASLLRAKFASNIEDDLINLIGKVSNQGIILSKNLFIRGEPEKGFILKWPEGERNVKIDNVLDMKESKQKLAEEIAQLDLPRNEKSLLLTLSSLFLVPNVSFNIMETQSRKEIARQRVETVFYNIKKGKVIVRKGDEVKKEDLMLIKIINQSQQTKPSWIINFSGTFLLFSLLFVTLWYYLKSVLKLEQALRSFNMMGIIILLSLFFYKFSNFLATLLSASTSFSPLTYIESYRHAFPFQIGTLLFAFLTVSHLALIYTVVNSLIIGYLFKANFFLMAYSFLGGLSAIYGIRYYGRGKRTSTFQAGFFLIAPVNIFVIITFHMISEKIGPVDLFLAEIFMGLLGGIISASLAFLFLPIFENIFSIPTQSKLLELVNSDLQIFRKMAMEAPGSYHHSLVVASLAESAAEDIKLDPVLVKAGALYHDIGKLKRPEYFIENQTRFPDIHKDLTPSMSTLVIVNHVKEGIELAKKLKLPKKIRDIIEQHHGSSLVRYFFQKAKEKYDPEMHKIGEESYRYAGPIPKSKEAALIMLADSVEAASRSLKSPSLASLKKMINDIFNSYIEDGQLDDSDFSLKELKLIAESFLSSLFTIYHPRVEYPGFDFEMKEARKSEKSQKANDRNNQPAEQTSNPSKKI